MEDGFGSTYLCRWIDCGCAFTEQEGLVRHIERRHVESSSGNTHGHGRRMQRDRDKEQREAKEAGEGFPTASASREDEFACLWQGCLRARPFNARYKLLIHMRVHTHEKPNKCTVSVVLFVRSPLTAILDLHRPLHAIQLSQLVANLSITAAITLEQGGSRDSLRTMMREIAIL